MPALGTNGPMRPSAIRQAAAQKAASGGSSQGVGRDPYAAKEAAGRTAAQNAKFGPRPGTGKGFVSGQSFGQNGVRPIKQSTYETTNPEHPTGAAQRFYGVNTGGIAAPRPPGPINPRVGSGLGGNRAKGRPSYQYRAGETPA
jgi:hypothetical protein